MNIALESPDQPDVVELITELDRYQSALYPPESNHFVDIATLAQPGVLFAVARCSDGAAGACGAIVLGPDYGEIKRMYVHPRLRGQGVAKALLAFLETAARERGCTLLQLERWTSVSFGWVAGGPQVSLPVGPGSRERWPACRAPGAPGPAGRAHGPLQRHGRGSRSGT